ncbi:hypothetical protein [Oscillatoria sp. FACHB-1407]|uniref:hypothetical protein n=1 Tax=Oscillatoria sp. FACHB-1407 TaxID=2692847 RepID=UPI0030D888B3
MDVPNLYPYWAGRWVLTGNHQVHMDASGLLGCFYNTSPADFTWVSSSPSLLTRVLQVNQRLIADTRRLQYRQGLNWFTLPRSRFAGINRLLPSQIVDFSNGQVVSRPLMPAINPNQSYEKTLLLIQQSLTTTLEGLVSEVDGRLWLGLSAGLDSRVILAIAHAAKINLNPFTRLMSRISMADRFLPPLLARTCGYKHTFLRQKPGNSRQNRKLLLIEHSAEHVSSGDAEPFLNGIRDDLIGLSIGGHGWEVFREFSEFADFPTTLDDPKIVAKQIAIVHGEPEDSSATAGIYDWLMWIYQYPQEGLDWQDRFCLEQGQAGWLSSKEQLYDMTPLERFPILNSAYNYSLVLSLSKEQRTGSKIQQDLIRQTYPKLLKYPIHLPDYYLRTLKTLIKNQLKSLLHLHGQTGEKNK